MPYDLFWGEAFNNGFMDDPSFGPFVDYYWGDGSYGTDEPPFVVLPSMEKIQDWTQQAVDFGVAKAEDWFKKLVGSDSGTSHPKYLRWVYPVQLLAAKDKNSAIDVYWFDDIFRVNPDGRWGITYSPMSRPAADLFWEKLGKTDHFFVMDCAEGKDTIDNYADCWFKEYGSGGGLWNKAAPGGKDGGLSAAGFGWLAIIALGILVWKGGFKIR